jgi:hypothetical protein
MNNGYVLGILLIILIILLVYLNTNEKNIEKWDDVRFNSYLPILSNNQRSVLDMDMDKAKRTEFSNGYKIEDDHNECIFQCKKKSTCKPTPTTSSQNPKRMGIGYRINYYPWFVPYSS